MIQTTQPNLRLIWDEDSHPSRQRLHDFIFGHMAEHSLKNAAKRTFEKYEQMLAHWGKLTADRWIDDLTQADVDDFAAKLPTASCIRGKFSAPVTIGGETRNSILRTLRAVLNAGIKARKITTLITIEIPTLDVFPSDCLTADQLRATVAQAVQRPGVIVPGMPWGPWWKVAYALAFYAGCRRGEMLRVQWENLVTRRRGNERWFYIPSTITKTKRSRQVICHPLLVEALDAMPGPHTGVILPRPSEDMSFVTTWHKKFQARAGLDPHEICHWHSLRGSMGEEMALLGLQQSAAAAQQALGHSTSETTRRHYVDVNNVLIPFLPKLW